MSKSFSVSDAKNSELGKASAYDPYYNPEKLFPISRQPKRADIGVFDEIPFTGLDQWTHYEVSWLNTKGKPEVAIAQISYASDSPYLIESKSMKLYFNSFNQTRFDSLEDLTEIVSLDLSRKIAAPVEVLITPLAHFQQSSLALHPEGICLDHLDIEVNHYQPEPNFLEVSVNSPAIEEIVYSDLLKSNCLVTGQPDWGSVQIHYQGRAISHEGLLKYIISFRQHSEFHEQCIERIFMDIWRKCEPEFLAVYGRYTRRGGIEINPCRVSDKSKLMLAHARLVRQ